MITKQNFIEMIELAEKFSAETDRWSDFGIDVVDLPIGEIPWKMFNTWYKSNFNPYGQDWIDWYLWERKDLRTGDILACYDTDGEKFFVETPEDLWDLVEEYVLQPCSDNKCQFKKSESCINS